MSRPSIQKPLSRAAFLSTDKNKTRKEQTYNGAHAKVAKLVAGQADDNRDPADGPHNDVVGLGVLAEARGHEHDRLSKGEG